MEIILKLRPAKDYAPLVLRLGMAAVFLYFGISQLISPEAFIGWLPKEVSMIPLSPRTFVVLNGGFEVFAGTLLAVGLYRRLAALFLGLHLMGITFTIGFTEIGVRDFGLAVAALTIVLMSEDYYSLDDYLRRKVNSAADKPQEENKEYDNQKNPY